MREALIVYRHEFTDVKATAELLRDKLWTLMGQMEEGKDEFYIYDPEIAKQYEEAYDALEALSTNFGIAYDDYTKAIRKGWESNG